MMKAPEMPAGQTTEEMIAESERFGEDYLRANPQFAGSFVPSYYSPPTYRAAKGSGPEGVEDFPRKNGAINGPGTGTSDDIPRCSPMASLFSRPSPFVTWAAEAVVKALPRCTS
jgi:hypothetical protein